MVGVPTLQARANVEGNKVIVAMQSMIPVSDYYDGLKFVTTNPLDGASKLTPLFLVLLIIEATDLMFALDNVPALYSIVPSGNVLVVYAATLFGIAFLRASYALVAVSLPHMAGPPDATETRQPRPRPRPRPES